MDTVIAEIRLKRGKKVDLPTEAPLGEPMWMEDTGELYIGQGEGKAPKLINENVASLRQAIQTLENNKANKVHTHTVEDIGGLNDTLTALRAEDVRLDEKIDQRIEEAISESSGTTYKTEYAKSGFVDFELETDKNLYDYPPIKIYKKNINWENPYEDEYGESVGYEKSFGYESIEEGGLYLSGNIYNEILPSAIVTTKAKADPTEIVGGSYPNGNPHAILIEVGKTSYSYYDINYEYHVDPTYEGVYVYRDTAHENIRFNYDYIYDSDGNAVVKSVFNGTLSLSPRDVDFENIYVDIIHSKDYIVPDNLVAIFSFGLNYMEDTMYNEKYAFLEPTSNGEFNIVLYDRPQATSELITEDFIARFGVKANTLNFIRNNEYNYTANVGFDGVIEAVRELVQMEGFENYSLMISFVTNNETVLPQETAFNDWIDNLHNAYYTTKNMMTNFRHEPITSRRDEMENGGDVDFPDYISHSGDSINITFYNLFNPLVIEDRDKRYKLDVELPPGSNAFISMFLGYETDFIAYDWGNEKFIVVGEDSYYNEDEGGIPLELLNNLRVEQWNDLFDLILEHSELNQSSTSLNIKLFIYTSKNYLEKTNPIKLKGLIAERVWSEWYEEDKNPLTTTAFYEDEETNKKTIEVALGYSAHNNYKNYGAIEGVIVKEDYMLSVPFEDYVKTDWSKSERRVEIRTAQELIDEIRNISTGTYFDIKNDIDFQNINLNNYLSNYYWTTNMTVNGNGYTFKNITTNGQSLFYTMQNCTIKDLTIENLYTEINSNNNSYSFGFFAETANFCTLENVVVKNSTIEHKSGNRYWLSGIGFLLGEAFATKITNCHIYNSHIKNLYTSYNYQSTGGFIGQGGQMVFEKCSFVGGSIKIHNNSGGIIGQASSSKFLDCYVNTEFVLNDYDTLISTDNYSGNQFSNFGGIVGYVGNHIHLENCYNYSTINGGCPLSNHLMSKSGFGSLIGYIDEWGNDNITRIKNCFYGGSGWHDYLSEIKSHYNQESGIIEPEDSYKYKNFKLIGNSGATVVGHDDIGLINVIYENSPLLPLNRDQMGDTELLKFDFENTWQLSTEGLPILKVQANHYMPNTPIRDLKVIKHTETHHVINTNFNVFEIELDVLDLSKITGFCSPSIESSYTGVFFTDRKLSELKATATETGQAIKTISFSKPSRSGRLAINTPRISSLTQISDFNGTWSRANVFTGRYYVSLSGFEFKEIMTKCITEFSKQQGDKIYMYISVGMPTDSSSTTTTSYTDVNRDKYRECVMKYAINEEEKIDYGKSDTKNVLIISSYDAYNFVSEELELISTLTFNGKIFPTLRNPDLFFLSWEDIKESFDLVILSKISPEHYYDYGIDALTDELLNYGIPVINTSSQLANYSYTTNYSYRVNHNVGDIIEYGTSIFGTSETYNMYDSQSYMTMLNTTNPIISSLGVTDNSQLQLVDTEIYNDTGIVFSSISEEVSVGQTLIKDANGNTLLAVVPKGTNEIKADYITYKLLDAPYGVLTQSGREIAKSVINHALKTNSETGNETYVYEGDVEFYGNDYLYDDGYMRKDSGNNGGGGAA